VLAALLEAHGGLWAADEKGSALVVPVALPVAVSRGGPERGGRMLFEAADGRPDLVLGL
jgi:hypothetical protein